MPEDAPPSFWWGMYKVTRALGDQDEVADQLIDDEQIDQPRRAMRTPEMPSIEEIQSHKETDIPFRSWCSVCIQAKSRQPASKRVEKAPGEVPIIQADYCFPALEPYDGSQRFDITNLTARDNESENCVSVEAQGNESENIVSFAAKGNASKNLVSVTAKGNASSTTAKGTVLKNRVSVKVKVTALNNFMSVATKGNVSKSFVAKCAKCAKCIMCIVCVRVELPR